MRSFPNRYPGSCSQCSVHVDADAGLAYKAGRWLVVCASSVCQDRAGIAPANGERKLTADGRVITPKDPAALPLIRSMPGARWVKDGVYWQVSLDTADRERVLELADRLKLDVAPELREYEAPQDAQEAASRLDDTPLYPFQRKGVTWLAPRTRAMLCDEMGLGKSAQVIFALPEGMGAVVVAPKSLLLNWRDEVAKWRPELRVTILKGRNAWQWPEPGEIVCVNYDILPARFVPKKSESKRVAVTQWTDEDREAARRTVLVCDEAHAVKSHNAARTKKVKALADVCARTWLLTATPLLGKPFDLWGVLSAGHMEREALGGWRSFMRLFDGSKNRWGGYEFGAVDPSVPERLRKVMLRRLRVDVLPDLPRKQYTTHTTNDLPKDLRADMDTAWEEWNREGGYEIEEWRESSGEPELVSVHRETEEPITLPPFERFSEIRQRLSEARIPAVIEYVEQFEDAETPLVVFSAHRAPVEALGEREGWAVIMGDTKAEDRHAAVKAFQAGALKGIAATVQAGGVGITLTRAAHVLFVSLDWTPALNAQAEDRCCRIGSTADSVQIIRMVSDHPLDRHIQKLLIQKQQLIEAAIEGRLTYDANQAPAPVTNRVDETQEQWQARMDAFAAAAAELDREEALGYVGRKLDAVESKHVGGGGARCGDITDMQADAIRAAWRYMIGRCDGAVNEDGVGFNSSDAGPAHRTMGVLDDERALRLAWYMLRKYKRQLQGGGFYDAIYS